MIKSSKIISKALFTLVLSKFAMVVFGQNIVDTTSSPIILEVNDTTYVLNDSMSVAKIDSAAFVNDTVASDSALIDSMMQESKFNFTSVGGNDSTYYSIYGHIFNKNDTFPIEYWKYNNRVHELILFQYDSTLQDLHINNPAFKKTMNNGFTGNIGGAVKSNIFAEPNPENGFIFMNSFTPYMFLANNATHYNVVKPYTVFKVDIGPNEEQDLDILHTQNVNPYLNAHIHFKNYSSRGSYINQNTRNNSGSFGTAYTKGRLASHFNWVFNKVNVEENGGVVDKILIIDSIPKSSEINTRLKNGSNYIKDRQLYFDQKIGFLKTNVPDSAELGAYWFSLQYTYQKQKSVRIYEDTDDEYTNASRQNLTLYENTFNDSTTIDSNNYAFSNHNFRINLEENPKSYPFVGAYFGYGIDNTDYFYSFNKDTANLLQHKSYKNSSYFEAGMYRLKGKRFKFSGNYKAYISGYRAGNMQLDGFISNKFGNEGKQFELKAEGVLYTKTPDFFLTNYYSNHYRWLNKFESEKRTTLKFIFNAPYIHTKIGARFHLLSDYIYLNEHGSPAQHPEVFTVFDVYVNNTLNFGPFAFYNRLNYQNTGNDKILPLPTFSGYAALYWKPNIYFKSTEGSVKFNLGTDIYYWTSYYAQAYSPALASFYNQHDEQIGNYPFIGVFWNVEIKRLRFYIRAEHASYSIIEPRNHFYSPNYPSNRMTIRYGLVWVFYD